MNGVWLKIKDLAFLDPGEFKGLNLSTLSETFDLSQILNDTPRNVSIDFSGAPLISWILGRMAYLSAAPEFPGCAIRRDSELGEINMRFLVTRGITPVAKLRIGILKGKTEFTGKSTSIAEASQLLNEFLSAMLEEPEQTMPIHVTATAHELGGHKNEYGIAHGQLLGALNVYE